MKAKKWEDTVIKPDELGLAIIKHPELPMGQAISIEQAEITWDKAEEHYAKLYEALGRIIRNRFKDKRGAYWIGRVDMANAEQALAEIEECK